MVEGRQAVAVLLFKLIPVKFLVCGVACWNVWEVCVVKLRSGDSLLWLKERSEGYLIALLLYISMVDGEADDSGSSLGMVD